MAEYACRCRTFGTSVVAFRNRLATASSAHLMWSTCIIDAGKVAVDRQTYLNNRIQNDGKIVDHAVWLSAPFGLVQGSACLPSAFISTSPTCLTVWLASWPAARLLSVLMNIHWVTNLVVVFKCLEGNPRFLYPGEGSTCLLSVCLFADLFVWLCDWLTGSLIEQLTSDGLIVELQICHCNFSGVRQSSVSVVAERFRLSVFCLSICSSVYLTVWLSGRKLGRTIYWMDY